MLDLRPVREIAAADIPIEIKGNRPFIVRGWAASGGGSLDWKQWRKSKVDVTVVPPNSTTVSHASNVLRRRKATVEMPIRELFERIEGNGRWQPLVAEGERYYLFGGRLSNRMINQLPWPEGLQFSGSSPYIASAGVTAKAHYDHWWTFLVQIHGSKTVKLFPPSDYCYLYPTYKKTKGKPRRALVDLDRPDLDRFPLLERLHGQIARMRAGDLLYIPVNWWHEVRTDDFSVGLNRRLRRGSPAWAAALVRYAYSLCKGRLVYGIRPVPWRELRLFAIRTLDAFRRDLGRLASGLRRHMRLPGGLPQKSKRAERSA